MFVDDHSQQASLFWRIWQPLDDIFASGHRHDWHTWHLSHPSLQVSIVGCDNIDLVPHDSIDNAVIGVRAFVAALEPLPSLISRNPQCNSILGTKLFELSHDTVCDDRYTFGIKTVHHRWQHFQLLLYCVGEEVGIDKDLVWRNESGVVLEEQRRGHLRTRKSQTCLESLV